MSQLSTVTDWNNHTTTVGYDPDGDPTTTTYPNGVVDTRTYNHADQLTNIADTHNTTSLLTFAYTPDPAANLATETDTGTPNPATTNYTYNKLQQLTAANANNYTYDPANNLTTSPTGATQAFNADSETCWTAPTSGTCASPPAGATTYAYNNEGDRTTTTPPTGGATTYSWNPNNQLTTLTPPAANPTTYTYDGNGLLQHQATTGTTTNYTWDTQASLPLLLADGTNYYIYADNPGPIEQVNVTTGTTSYLLADHLGSTRAITDPTGAIIGSDTYDAWGNQAGSTGTATTPFLYAGQYQDPTNGIYYLRARWYDPTTGQFLSLDPDPRVHKSGRMSTTVEIQVIWMTQRATTPRK